MARKKMDKKSEIESVAQDLIRYEENDLPTIKEGMKERQEMRKALASLLEQKAEIPGNATVFAGLKITDGRVNYKELVEYLAERCKMGKSELQALIEKYRKPGLRLKYGKITEKTVCYQEEFEFATPKSIFVDD